MRAGRLSYAPFAADLQISVSVVVSRIREQCSEPVAYITREEEGTIGTLTSAAEAGGRTWRNVTRTGSSNGADDMGCQCDVSSKPQRMTTTTCYRLSVASQTMCQGPEVQDRWTRWMSRSQELAQSPARMPGSSARSLAVLRKKAKVRATQENAPMLGELGFALQEDKGNQQSSLLDRRVGVRAVARSVRGQSLRVRAAVAGSGPPLVRQVMGKPLREHEVGQERR